MKRKGFLIEKVADIDNLRLAFFKAQRGKQDKVEVIDFGSQLDKSLMSLHDELLLGKVTIGGYSYFRIYDPKERLICAAPFRQRVLHHALMNVCHSCFERYQIYHSYASRKGKGGFAAIAIASRYQRKYPWFLQLDFHKFFDSIDHQVLYNQINRLFKDPLLLS